MEIRASSTPTLSLAQTSVAAAISGAVAFAVTNVLLVGSHVFPNIDLLTHYRWIFQFARVLGEGTLYPRWMPLSNYGFGEPAFVIYQPLYFYFAAAVSAVTGDVWLTMRLLVFASTLFAGLLVFSVLAKRCEWKVALVGAVLIEVQPLPLFLAGYHAAFPWQFSLPLAVLLIHFSLSNADRLINVPLSVTVALLTAAHVLVAFMFLVCLSLAHALGMWERGFRQASLDFISWVVSAGLGLALAGVYLLPALGAPPLLNTETWDDAVYLNWRNSFAFPLVTASIYGTRWFGVQWVLAVLALAVTAACVFLLWHGRGDRDQSWWCGGRLVLAALIALILSSEISFPIYAASELMRRVQWPYRFLTVATFASCLALPMIVGSLRAGKDKVAGMRLLWAGVALSVLVLIPTQYRLWSEGSTPPLGPSTVERFVGQRGMEPSTVGKRWRDTDANAILQSTCGQPDARCSTLLDHSHHRVWEVSFGTSARMLLPVFAFPAWMVTIDAEPVPTSIDPDTGVIVVDVPAGTHRVDLKWSPLPQERAGTVSSVLALGVLMLTVLWRRTGWARQRKM